MKGYHHLTALFLVFCCPGTGLFAQPNFPGNPAIFRITSSHTSFPDTGRVNGHLYDGKFYDADSHYHDSSVMIIVPPGFKKGKEVRLVFWFHGWNNNIDTATVFYQLADQFMQSNKNAILVLAETSVNAPDSYGGKLEQPNVFRDLLTDVLDALKQKKIISQNSKAGKIAVAGHSGAYRVIAYILQNGGIAVNEVLLFDALYSEVDKFTNWIEQDKQHRFVHWFTNHGGGTDEVSVDMMKGLKEKNIPYVLLEEKDANAVLLKSSRIVFVHSLREHNVIINNPDNFTLLLVTSSL